MPQISVVIIAKNEAENIVACIWSAKKLSNDIIVIDSGSNDNTVSLSKNNAAKVRSVFWINYGNARNIGARLASHDWILALDADERITDELANSIAANDFNAVNKIYGFKRLNFLDGQKIKYGPLGHDRVFRLYNRKHVAWNDVEVHEKLVAKNMTRCMLQGKAEHYGNRTPEHYFQKKIEYASLWAIKQQQLQKKYGFGFRLSSTVMSFIKAYFIQMGFLDMQYGFRLAKINAFYTWYKYGLLQKLSQQANAISFEKIGSKHKTLSDQKVPEVSEA